MGCGASSKDKKGSADGSSSAPAVPTALVACDAFETPFEPLAKSGGTAAFFRARYRADATEPFAKQNLDYWLAKDVARARDEVTFYEVAQSLKAEPGWEFLNWMVPYRGISKALCKTREDSPPEELEVMLIQNSRAGYKTCRMLDIKIGSVTAVADWQGKSAFGAWTQSWLDWATSSACHGSRLEGFDSPPQSLKSVEALVAKSRVVKEKKLKRLHLQCMSAAEYLKFFLDLQDSPEHNDAMTRSGESPHLCKAEMQELVLLRCIEELSGFLSACRKAPVPQQWIGSSVMLAFDCHTAFLRDEVLSGGSSSRDLARVHVFDWGRSELNTDANHKGLSANDQSERRKYWWLYCEGVAKLLHACCSLYVLRYWRPLQTLALTVWDKDQYSDDDYIGCVIVPLKDVTDGSEPLVDSDGEAVTSGLMNPSATMLRYSAAKVACSTTSRLETRWAVKIQDAMNIPNMDLVSQSDCVVEVSALADDAASVLQAIKQGTSSPDTIREAAQVTSLKHNTATPQWDEEFEIATIKPESKVPFMRALTVALGREQSPCTEVEIDKLFPALPSQSEEVCANIFAQQVFPDLSVDWNQKQLKGLDSFPQGDILRLIHFGRWLRAEAHHRELVFLLFLFVAMPQGIHRCRWSTMRFAKVFLQVGQTEQWFSELQQAVTALEAAKDMPSNDTLMPRCKAFLKQIALAELRAHWRTYDWQNQDEEFAYNVELPLSDFQRTDDAPHRTKSEKERRMEQAFAVVNALEMRYDESEDGADGDGEAASVLASATSAKMATTATTTSSATLPTARRLKTSILGEVSDATSYSERVARALPLIIQATERARLELRSLAEAANIIGPEPLLNPELVAVQKFTVPAGGCRFVPSPGTQNLVFESVGSNMLAPLRRDVAKISDEELVRELGDPTQLCKVFETNSKSGELFMVSPTGRMIIKSISGTEAEALIAVMPEYVKHVRDPEGSILGHYVGLYRMDFGFGKGQRYLTIMRSVFEGAGPESPKIIYDMKGATRKRWARQKKDGSMESVMKDVNWMQEGRHLRLSDEASQYLQRMHSRDTLFLQKMYVMDFSILIGISPLEGSGDQTTPWAWRSADGKETYLVGIIDFLVEFSLKFRTYHLFKHQMTGKANSSALADPESYSKRQRAFFAQYVLGSSPLQPSDVWKFDVPEDRK